MISREEAKLILEEIHDSMYDGYMNILASGGKPDTTLENDIEAYEVAIEALRERPNIERMVLLLGKCHELLSKQKGSYYVLNILAETVFYDGAECDGQCLMEDIEYLLEEFDMRGEEE